MKFQFPNGKSAVPLSAGQFTSEVSPRLNSTNPSMVRFRVFPDFSLSQVYSIAAQQNAVIPKMLVEVRVA
jgi:hypothetical protein